MFMLMIIRNTLNFREVGQEECQSPGRLYAHMLRRGSSNYRSFVKGYDKGTRIKMYTERKNDSVGGGISV
jgi:hypothetical protein